MARIDTSTTKSGICRTWSTSRITTTQKIQNSIGSGTPRLPAHREKSAGQTLAGQDRSFDEAIAEQAEVISKINHGELYHGRALESDSAEVLSCFGGDSPITKGKISTTLGASSIRAPAETTVISGQVIKIDGKVLSNRQIARSGDKTLESFIKQTTALEFYDDLPGVPYLKAPPSDVDKITALIRVLRTTGVFPHVGIDSESGVRDALPYWNVPVEQRKASETLSTSDALLLKGLIEDQLDASEEP